MFYGRAARRRASDGSSIAKRRRCRTTGPSFKLNDAGAIRGYTIVIDPKTFGFGIAALVRIPAAVLRDVGRLRACSDLQIRKAGCQLVVLEWFRKPGQIRGDTVGVCIAGDEQDVESGHF